MSRCLVIGANGFIGSHLVDALINSGNTVRAFGRFKQAPLFNLNDSIEIVKGDFLNEDDLRGALDGIEYVFHFVSTTTPITAENDPLIDIETNIRMSVRLFQLCVEAQVKRVIFASTGGAIYGESIDRPWRESDLPQPVSPYAIGKLTIEHYLRYFRIKVGLDSVVLRISNPYGERQQLHRKQGVIPIFLENIVSNRPLTVLGDGTMIRDYIYVKDAVAMAAGMFDKPKNFDVYNIGSGQGTSVLDLVKAVDQVTGKNPEIIYNDAPATYINKVVLDTKRFTDEFHIVPQTALLEGLVPTYAYIKQEVEQHGTE
jgi:UDP-glucose 4-epimerase